MSWETRDGRADGIFGSHTFVNKFGEKRPDQLAHAPLHKLGAV